MEEYTLYRTYSKDGTLLYIGQSNSWPRRFIEHRKQSSWFSIATQVQIESFLTKQQLDEAEIYAIKTEKPAYNIMHNAGEKRDIAANLDGWGNRSRHKNSVSEDICWNEYMPYGEDNCFKCGRGVAGLNEVSMTIPEMVLAIERDGDIKDGVATYCIACYSGFMTGFRESDRYLDEMSEQDRRKAEVWIDAEDWRRHCELVMNRERAQSDLKKLNERIEYAEEIVENRVEARRILHNKISNPQSYGVKRHHGWVHFRTDPVWPLEFPRYRPIESNGYIFGPYLPERQNGWQAVPTNGSGLLYTWNQSTKQTHRRPYTDGHTVGEQWATENTYGEFIALVLRVEGHK